MMRLQPSEVRAMPLPDLLLLADAYAEARKPPDKRRPGPVPASVIAALKQHDTG
jgi:hypothetical protein